MLDRIDKPTRRRWLPSWWVFVILAVLYPFSMGPVGLITHWVVYGCGGTERQVWSFLNIVYAPADLVLDLSDWVAWITMMIAYALEPFEPW